METRIHSRVGDHGNVKLSYVNNKQLIQMLHSTFKNNVRWMMLGKAEDGIHRVVSYAMSKKEVANILHKWRASEDKDRSTIC